MAVPWELFLPISLIVAVAIKLESPDGPIFADTPPELVKWQAVCTYKFRSMIPNAVNYLKEHQSYLKNTKNSFKLVDDLELQMWEIYP